MSDYLKLLKLLREYTGHDLTTCKKFLEDFKNEPKVLATIKDEADFTEKGEWNFETHEHVGYMMSKEGNNSFSMFINENFEYGEGGFSWQFLDFKPEDVENYKPIYIYLHSVAEIIKQYQTKARLHEIKYNSLKANHMKVIARIKTEVLHEVQKNEFNHKKAWNAIYDYFRKFMKEHEGIYE